MIKISKYYKKKYIKKPQYEESDRRCFDYEEEESDCCDCDCDCCECEEDPSPICPPEPFPCTPRITLIVSPTIQCSGLISGTVTCDRTPVRGTMVTLTSNSPSINFSSNPIITDSNGTFTTVLNVTPRTMSTLATITALTSVNGELISTSVTTTVSCPSLVAVNTAQNTAEMRAAIEDPQLGLNLAAYNNLTDAQKNQVANTVLMNRPSSGYPTVASVQIALNNAIDSIVDPNNVFVRAGSVGGDGSRANPFGTIQEGITAVNIGGTVHILEGTYPITTQINVNKSDITLLGENDPLLLLEADLIPILITASGVTIDDLTITSDIPYAKEFIQVGANNVSLLNNTIYGPSQLLPMSNWVVNRAVVSQVGISNILLEGNTFYSLRTGMYINPNTTGAINNNVVYNTKGGFLVDGAFTTFVGNSWGIPPNEFDIVLLPGTTTGPPYNNIPALKAANNNATISDQR